MIRGVCRFAALMFVLALLGACAQETAAPRLTIYSGRSEKLMGPLLERFEQESGIGLAVRYADTSELTARQHGGRADGCESG